MSVQYYYFFIEPNAFPEKLKAIGSTFTTITLTWERLSCVDHNGNITGYEVQYGTTTIDTRTVTGELDDNDEFVVTELEPMTVYKFRVAAVNSNGTGLYSTPVQFQTTVLQSEYS